MRTAPRPKRCARDGRPSIACADLSAPQARSPLSGSRLHAGELLQRLARDPEQPPLLHAHRAQALVEADRRLVPVEDHPLEAPALALVGDAREGKQKCPAAASAAMRGLHEQVLEVEALPAEESGKV